MISEQIWFFGFCVRGVWAKFPAWCLGFMLFVCVVSGKDSLDGNSADVLLGRLPVRAFMRVGFLGFNSEDAVCMVSREGSLQDVLHED